jgi:hypothetical protein
MLMARRMLNLPDRVEKLVLENSLEGESFSSAVTRLIEKAAGGSRKRKPRYVGTFEGPPDLGRLVEHYLRNPVPMR